jgi:leader peptidase (prepilin peptidase) / N-methyltransferase
MSFEPLLVLFVGLAFGSFVTLLSYRLPLGEDVIIKPSRCPKCGTTLTFFDLWPVVSWIASKGQCRHCHQSISIRYPLTEIITSVGFLWMYGLYGITSIGIIMALVWVALMVMIVVDLEHYIIPDTVQVALLILGVAYHMVLQTPSSDVIYGTALGLGIALALRFGYQIIRKNEGLGMGDVKFFTVAGLWLGIKAMVPFMFLAGVLGVITGVIWKRLGRGDIFPFGPALAIALLLSIVAPQSSNLFWNIQEMLK